MQGEFVHAHMIRRVWSGLAMVPPAGSGVMSHHKDMEILFKCLIYSKS